MSEFKFIVTLCSLRLQKNSLALAFALFPVKFIVHSSYGAALCVCTIPAESMYLWPCNQIRFVCQLESGVCKIKKHNSIPQRRGARYRNNQIKKSSLRSPAILAVRPCHSLARLIIAVALSARRPCNWVWISARCAWHRTNKLQTRITQISLVIWIFVTKSWVHWNVVLHYFSWKGCCQEDAVMNVEYLLG